MIKAMAPQAHERIIQIAATAGGDNNEFDTIYALTDRGQVFSICPAASNPQWSELPLITIKKGESNG